MGRRTPAAGDQPVGFAGGLVDLYAELRAISGSPSLETIARRVQAFHPTKPARSTVSAVLNGTKIPRGDLAAAMAAALGGSPERQARARMLAEAASADRSAARANALIGDSPAKPSTWWARCGYIEQVRDIAPAGVLLDREAELAELDAFCRTDEPYLWWRAGPWAGKSALMSTFVLNPPAGVEVVSFFITGRLAAQADSTAFTNALIDQFSAIVGETVPTALAPSARDALRRALLQVAAAKIRRDGRRLVLAVDGLDEDRSCMPGSGLPSVASMLPRSPVHGIQVIVASRPDPPIPDDVPADHLLRRCSVRRLQVSPHAAQLAIRARRELREHLIGDPLHRDVVGLITAAGGGLSLRELEELTGQAPYELEGVLGGPFGRTIGLRTDVATPDTQRLYLFTHETLQEEAVAQLGASLVSYRQRIHTWADVYGQQGWPAQTPQYLLRAYPRMLLSDLDSQRLTALAVNRRRHDRQLDLTGGDLAALTEIKSAQDLIGEQEPPDLLTVARLAACRDDLAARNAYVPVSLPAVWARLQQPVRAESLAHSIIDPERQTRALIKLAEALAETDLGERAEAVAQTVQGQREQTQAFAALAEAFAKVGDFDRAEAAAGSISEKQYRDDALAGVAERAAATGAADRAEALLTAITDPDRLMQARGEIVTKLAAIGAFEAAKAIAACVSDPDRRSEAFARLTIAIANTTTRKVPGAIAVAAAVDSEEASAAESDAQTADTIARRLADAEASVREVIEPWQRDRRLVSLASTIAASGDHQRASTVADSISDSRERKHVAIALLVSAADTGHDEWARHWARTIIDDQSRRFALRAAVAHAVENGDFGRAEVIAAEVSTIDDQLSLLTTLAHWALQAEEPELASRLALRTEALARSRIDPDKHEHEVTTLALAAIAAGQYDLAEILASVITHSIHRAWVLADLAVAAATNCDHTIAFQAAASISEVSQRVQVLMTLAGIAASTGDQDRAHKLVDQAETAIIEIRDPGRRAQAHLNLARFVVTAGLRRRNLPRLNESEIIPDLSSLDDLSSNLVSLTSAVAATGADTLVSRFVAQAEAVSGAGAPEKWARYLTIISGVMAAGEYHVHAALVADRAATIAKTAGPELRAQVLTDLVAQALGTGDGGRASRLVNEVMDGLQRANGRGRCRALRHLAVTLAEGSAFDLAEAVVRAIPDPALAGAAWIDLLEMVSTSADLDLAEEIIETINGPKIHLGFGDPDRYVAAVTRSATLANASGEIARGTRLAVEAASACVIASPPQRVRTLIACAAFISEGGLAAQYVAEAEAVIRTLADPIIQAKAYATLAQLPGQARHIASAFAAAHWLVPMIELARIDPQAVVQLAYERLARTPVLSAPAISPTR